jgi:ribosome maturation factor RimP
LEGLEDLENYVVGLSPEEDELIKIIEPLLDGEGFELVRLCFKRTQSKALLGLFIDVKGQPNSVTMENLEFVSRFISDVLDASEIDQKILRSAYDLEVSSPGLDRWLTKKSHFENVVNKRIKVRLKQADAKGSRNLIGLLLDFEPDGIILELDNKKETKKIAFADMAEAHMIFEFNKKNAKKLGVKA